MTIIHLFEKVCLVGLVVVTLLLIALGKRQNFVAISEMGKQWLLLL
jgi:hypothetical protein